MQSGTTSNCTLIPASTSIDWYRLYFIFTANPLHDMKPTDIVSIHKELMQRFLAAS